MASIAMNQPRLLVLAGPNGAGKTTFAHSHLRQYVDAGLFLNADDLAHEINAGNIEAAAVEAGRLIIKRRRTLIESRRSFAIETTLASLTLLRDLQAAKKLGFVCQLYFLFLSSAHLCDFRVKQRVILGGHSIPQPVIQRRYTAGLALLPRYLAEVDEAEIFHADADPVTTFVKSATSTEIADRGRFDLLQALIRIAGGVPISS
jgi:predicted ABC-type ATPase